MAMEMHVLSERRLSSMSEWQRAVSGQGYSLRFPVEIDLAGAKGLVPVDLGGVETGFEIYPDDAKAVMNQYGGSHFIRPYKFALGFRWRGDLNELRAAWMAATAYARETDGVIFDPQANQSYSGLEGDKVVKQIEQSLPAASAAMQEIFDKFSRERR
jgi:hypothetical protein